MSGMVGADVEGLDSFGRSLANAGDRIDRLQGELGAALEAIEWRGPDAEQFKSQWPEHRRSLQAAATALADTATVIHRHAEEQRRASSEAGYTGGHGGAGGGGHLGGGGGGDGWNHPSVVNEHRASASASGRLGSIDWSAGASVEALTTNASVHRYFTTPKFDPLADQWTPFAIGLGASAAANLAAVAVQGKTGIGPATVAAEGSARVAASVEGDAHLSAGPDGLKAHAGVGGRAGASAEGSVSGEVYGQSATASGHVIAGLELSADADVSITPRKIEFSLEAGAALGLGAGGGFKVELDPLAAAGKLKEFAHLW